VIFLPTTNACHFHLHLPSFIREILHKRRHRYFDLSQRCYTIAARCSLDLCEPFMSNKPPAGSEPKDEDKQPKARKWTMLISLLIIEIAIASTILTLGVRKFASWYCTTRPKKRQNDVLFYTILLIATCAPACVFFGMFVATAYYYIEKKEHGEYKVTMRKQRRGYIMDLTDLEDKEREHEEKKTNAVIAEKTKEENEQKDDKRTIIRFSEQPTLASIPTSERMSMVASWASGAGVSTVCQPELTRSTNKYSSVNPYGWTPEAEEPQRVADLSDAWKAYRNSPMTKKGVDNIWLGGGGNRASDGKGKVKSSWDADVEMGVVRKGTI
jgi:hypothetical protein